MSQIAQLSEAEIEARFHVTGARPVAFLLTGFTKTADQFSVFCNAGDDSFLTTLLAVFPEKNQLIFDCSGSSESNRRLLASQQAIFVGHPGGIRVQFTCGPVMELIYGGEKAFAVHLPKVIVRLQRRESFRIETPRLNPLQFFGRASGGEQLKLPIHDISVTGIGLTASSEPVGLASGMRLEKCHFALPGDEHDLFFNATVAQVSERAMRGSLRQWHIGLQFNKLSGAEENRIQRYIARIERERHELL